MLNRPETCGTPYTKLGIHLEDFRMEQQNNKLLAQAPNNAVCLTPTLTTLSKEEFADTVGEAIELGLSLQSNTG